MPFEMYFLCQDTFKISKKKSEELQSIILSIRILGKKCFLFQQTYQIIKNKIINLLSIFFCKYLVYTKITYNLVHAKQVKQVLHVKQV